MLTNIPVNGICPTSGGSTILSADQLVEQATIEGIPLRDIWEHIKKTKLKFSINENMDGR
ncbi:hypothetical protein [Paenisporosarcina sp. NPDC076907]